VALFSFIGGKRKYSTNDYVTALIATLGMIVYNIEDVSPLFNLDETTQ